MQCFENYNWEVSICKRWIVLISCICGKDNQGCWKKTSLKHHNVEMEFNVVRLKLCWRWKKFHNLICINWKNYVAKNEKFKIVFIVVKTLFSINDWMASFARQIMLAHSSFSLVYKGANICTSLLYLIKTTHAFLLHTRTNAKNKPPCLRNYKILYLVKKNPKITYGRKCLNWWYKLKLINALTHSWIV